MQNTKTLEYKIGHSKKPEARVKQLQTGCPGRIRLVAYHEVRHPRIVESMLHQHFAEARSNGEWFVFEQSDVELFFKSECVRLDMIADALKDNVFYIKRKRLS